MGVGIIVSAADFGAASPGAPGPKRAAVLRDGSPVRTHPDVGTNLPHRRYDKREAGKRREIVREDFVADWAFGITGAIENYVRRHYPQELRRWPLLQVFDAEAYELPSQHLTIVLRDQLSGIPSVSGLRPFPYDARSHPCRGQGSSLGYWGPSGPRGSSGEILDVPRLI